MIIVTGAAGFIGSRLIKKLNENSIYDIIAVDDLQDGLKMRNLAEVQVADYFDASEFLGKIEENSINHDIEHVFHLGACSSTTEWDGKYVMQVNFSYSKSLLNWCANRSINLVYASSAAVYGHARNGFREEPNCEKPINMYGYSKFLFDHYVRLNHSAANHQVVGLRFFNVYGPHEAHKGKMASVAFHAYQQLNATNKIKLFGAFGGVEAGEQQRDFIYVDDCVKVLKWFQENSDISGIYNVGTGNCKSFNDLANTIIGSHGSGKVEYIEIPEHLKKSYQNYTQADLTALRSVGYPHSFKCIKHGIADYIDWLRTHESFLIN